MDACGVVRPWDTVSQASSSSGATMMVAGTSSGAGGPSSLSGGGHRTPGESIEGSVGPLDGLSRSLEPLASRRLQLGTFDVGSGSSHRQGPQLTPQQLQQTSDDFFVLQSSHMTAPHPG